MDKLTKDIDRLYVLVKLVSWANGNYDRCVTAAQYIHNAGFLECADMHGLELPKFFRRHLEARPKDVDPKVWELLSDNKK